MSNYQCKSAQAGRSRLGCSCILIKRTLLLPQKAVAFTTTNIFINICKQGSWTFTFLLWQFSKLIYFRVYYLCSVTYHLHFYVCLSQLQLFLYFLMLFKNIWLNSRERMERPDETTLKNQRKCTLCKINSVFITRHMTSHHIW